MNEIHQSMDFRALSVFVHAGDSGSFTATAQALGMSPSAVSKAVSRLEAALGVRLFERTTRRVRFTAEGQALQIRCRQVLDDLREARDCLQMQAGRVQGLLRISLPLAYGRQVALPRLVALLRKHPQLAIEASFSDRRVDLIEEGFDAALRIGELRDARLVARGIDTVDYVVCAAPDYLRAHGTPLHPHELEGHACVPAYGHDGRPCGWSFRVDGRDWSPAAATPRLALDHGEALPAAALAGAGLIYVQRYLVAQALADGRLQVLLDAFMPPSRQVSVVYPAGRNAPPRLRALVTELAASAAAS
jgi:LysR family transcriptional regulator, regulator for bpeEF and oprC